MLIELRGVSKEFRLDRGVRRVLHDINLTINASEAISLVGPNGVGKSTLAAIVAGIDQKFSGELRRISDMPAQVPMLFQDYRASLLPWLSIRDNITFPLALRKISRAERNELCDEIIACAPERLDLRVPTRRLSGGQSQLVCILRTLIVSPRLIVCDEPFSAIDYQARLLLREVLGRICQERSIAMLFISHSMEDAILLADRVIVLKGNPATISNQITIETPRPRRAAWLDSVEAVEVRRLLRDAIEAKL